MDIVKQIIDVFEASMKKNIQISAGTNFRTDLGLDSLKLMGIMLKLEQNLDVEFPLDDITPENLNTISDLAELVTTALNAQCTEIGGRHD